MSSEVIDKLDELIKMQKQILFLLEKNNTSHYFDSTSNNFIPQPCRSCSNHPSNGGSGICNCILGTMEVTC